MIMKTKEQYGKYLYNIKLQGGIWGRDWEKIREKIHHTEHCSTWLENRQRERIHSRLVGYVQLKCFIKRFWMSIVDCFCL